MSSFAPLDSSRPIRTMPVGLIAAVLFAVLLVGSALALGLHTPDAPVAPYEKTLDVSGQ